MLSFSESGTLTLLCHVPKGQCRNVGWLSSAPLTLILHNYYLSGLTFCVLSMQAAFLSRPELVQNITEGLQPQLVIAVDIPAKTHRSQLKYWMKLGVGLVTFNIYEVTSVVKYFPRVGFEKEREHMNQGRQVKTWALPTTTTDLRHGRGTGMRTPTSTLIFLTYCFKLVL